MTTHAKVLFLNFPEEECCNDIYIYSKGLLPCKLLEPTFSGVSFASPIHIFMTAISVLLITGN